MSPWHFVFNLYFLVLFGRRSEQELGVGRFLALVALAALAGKLLYVVIAGSGGVPSLGASGGISGIMAFYGLAFPAARVRFLDFVPSRGTTPLPTPISFTFSARAALWLWLGLQVAGALLQLRGTGTVNHLAHLGGAAVGAAFWLRRRG